MRLRCWSRFCGALRHKRIPPPILPSKGLPSSGRLAFMSNVKYAAGPPPFLSPPTSPSEFERLQSFFFPSAGRFAYVLFFQFFASRRTCLRWRPFAPNESGVSNFWSKGVFFFFFFFFLIFQVTQLSPPTLQPFARGQRMRTPGGLVPSFLSGNAPTLNGFPRLRLVLNLIPTPICQLLTSP